VFGGFCLLLFFAMPLMPRVGGVVLFLFGQVSLIGLSLLKVLFGEFDPGSGRTLAACLTHASRTESAPLGVTRVANG
jgi:hypothetical protein